MKKMIALALALVTLLVTLTGCFVPDPPIEHVHIFDIKTVSEATHATDATCTARATYYYTCRCNEIGTATFEHGDLLPHVYGKNTDKKYMKGTYDCTKQTEYYHACTVCGEKGTTTFFHGEVKEHSPNLCETYCVDCGWYKEHVFDQQIIDEKYMKGEYNCKKQTEYYYSCECGAKGEETFLHGEIKEHVYSTDCDTFCDDCNAKRTAPQKHAEVVDNECTSCHTDPRKENWIDWDEF